MKLEELKHIWQEAHTVPEIEAPWSREEIRQLLWQRSRRSLAQINQNIWIEGGLVVLLGVMAVAGLWLSGLSVTAVEIAAITLYMLLSVLFYRAKYQALNARALASENLKEALIELTRTLSRYIGFYRFVSGVLVPVFACGGMLYGMWKWGEGTAFEWTLVSGWGWGLIMGAMAVFTLAMIAFSRWYTKRVYGTHYEELTACLEELEDS